MIPFAKYQCAGNDFIVFPEGHRVDPSAVPSLCHRRFGIGADGVLTWAPEGEGFRFKIFNPDGSEAEMCGNGLRCIAHCIAQEHGATLLVFSQKRRHKCTVKGTVVEVDLGAPKWNHMNVQLESGFPSVDVIDTGVPHAVFMGEGFDTYAEKIRVHPAFSPNGVNVTCIENGCIRTFERGVEGETYSCGTGAAAALAYLHKREGRSEFTASFRRGTTLFQRLENNAIIQSAEVYMVFQGIHPFHR